tara:strand:- start:341 stop:772 length:432 start_codon:yes stop_codon:yes gene_type:complete
VETELIFLGIAAFLAATLIPVSSEIIFTGYLALGYSKIYCLIIASLGNCLGTSVNYAIGMAGLIAARKYLRFAPSTESKLQTLNQRYGTWALLFAWVPVVGDPLTVLAGVARTRWWTFVLIVFGGRIVRYLFILYLFQESSSP